VFKIDIPGVEKDEVKVMKDEDNTVQISGYRTREKEEETDTWHCLERSTGFYLRWFKLPENAMLDQMKATMRIGVLTLTVPKEEVKGPDQVY
jgi:HSP20 family protein